MVHAGPEHVIDDEASYVNSGHSADAILNYTRKSNEEGDIIL
jgi:hypothetical protein